MSNRQSETKWKGETMNNNERWQMCRAEIEGVKERLFCLEQEKTGIDVALSIIDNYMPKDLSNENDNDEIKSELVNKLLQWYNIRKNFTSKEYEAGYWRGVEDTISLINKFLEESTP